MLSQALLAQIDKRLRQATGKNTFFGGISMILVGDPGQLLPVGGSPLYNFPTKNALSAHGLLCYQQFTNAIRLEQVERQKNLDNDPEQAYFLDLLTRARNGMKDKNFIESDWKFLLRNKKTPASLELFNNAVRLFMDNQSCHNYNAEKLKSLNSPITCIKAKNSPLRVKNLSSDNFSNLTNLLYLAIDARITLTNNLWTAKGLVNGASGVIKDIIYSETESMPHTIFIEFDNYVGPKFFNENDERAKWIPINPTNIYNNNVGGARQQYAFRLAYASTIHKSQGQTLEKVVIDLGNNERSLGLTFVALSRVKNYKDFLIEAFCRDRLEKISQSSSLGPRLKEEARIEKILSNTKRNHSNISFN
jgi:ATP-dependent DNA helicase PIF1